MISTATLKKTNKKTLKNKSGPKTLTPFWVWLDANCRISRKRPMKIKVEFFE